MIEFENVSKSFSQTIQAVDNVSLTVPEGTVACIIGTSGCGKTTCLKMINRLVELSSGNIRIRGQKQITIPLLELRRSIGYVIQEVGLFPHLTVFQNTTLLEEVKKIPKQKQQARYEQMMELVGLDPKQFQNRYPNKLSGGQKQRVGIARALMSDPDILLMDEPFGALDPITRGHLHEEFLQLNQKLHKTIVLVTHDLHEAFRLGDKVHLMHQGKIVQTGTKREDFLQNPKNDFVKSFVESQLI